jgi:hypothetical protein
MGGTTAVAKGSPFTSFAERVADQPVFVVLGVQGSGTNLLSRILRRAFRFLVVEDGSVIFNTAARLGSHPSPAQIRRAFELIHSRLVPSAVVRKTCRVIKVNADYTDLDRHLDADAVRCGADFARFVYAYGAFRLGTSCIAIKSDDLWEEIGHIDDVLPNRRVILLTRDFRDNLLSVSKKDFGPIEPLKAAWYVKTQFAHYRTEFQRTPHAHRYLVRYEDLLDSPLSVVHGLSGHFGLPCVAGGEGAIEALNIRRGNVRKWNTLGARTLGHVEALLREELTDYGYGLTAGSIELPGAGHWAMAAASDSMKRVAQKGKRFVKRLGR